MTIYWFQDDDGYLTMGEFMEGSKKDPSIIQALSLYDGHGFEAFSYIYHRLSLIGIKFFELRRVSLKKSIQD